MGGSLIGEASWEHDKGSSLVEYERGALKVWTQKPTELTGATSITKSGSLQQKRLIDDQDAQVHAHKAHYISTVCYPHTCDACQFQNLDSAC